MNSKLVNICLMIINIIFTISSSNVLTLKLIHRDPPQSPLFQPNLSTLQSYFRDIQISKTRVSNIKSLETKFHKTIFGRTLSFTGSIFTLNLRIGTPETKSALVFDTKAPLTWMQCKPCTNCFKQKLPIFDPAKSSTFRQMNKNHTLSNFFNCTSHRCNYSVKIRNGQWSSGLVLTERFQSLNKEVVFGCGRSNRPGPQTGVTGVLGMGNFPTSFVRQLADKADARFSYCLSSRRAGSLLRIGGDDLINKHKHVQTTMFLRGLPAGKSLRGGEYRLKLIGISVAGKRLDIPIRSFHSGCIIDTASPFSVLEIRAYRAMRDAISGYLMWFKDVKRISNKKYPNNLCYTYKTGFSKFPGMVWHFEGANLEVNGTNLFLFGKNMLGSSKYFCLQMLGSLKTNVLGAYQQQDVRFLYDLDNEKLSFVHESC